MNRVIFALLIYSLAIPFGFISPALVFIGSGVLLFLGFGGFSASKHATYSFHIAKSYSKDPKDHRIMNDVEYDLSYHIPRDDDRTKIYGDIGIIGILWFVTAFVFIWPYV
ncbi:MAG: hypothetical protein R6U61_02825 [Thermoplasmata archaeon]